MSASSASNRANFVLSGGLIAFGVIGSWLASRIHSEVAVDPVGPRAYPLILFGLFTIVSVILFVRNSLALRAEANASAAAPLANPRPESGAIADIRSSSKGFGGAPNLVRNAVRTPPVRVIGFLGAIFLYSRFLESAGYLLSTTLLLAAVLLLLGTRPVKTVAVAVGVTATLYAFFALFLSIPLPSGNIF